MVHTKCLMHKLSDIESCRNSRLECSEERGFFFEGLESTMLIMKLVREQSNVHSKYLHQIWTKCQ